LCGLSGPLLRGQTGRLVGGPVRALAGRAVISAEAAPATLVGQAAAAAVCAHLRVGRGLLHGLGETTTGLHRKKVLKNGFASF